MSYPEYIPGPNNELILQKPRPTGSYPVAVDFATSASYAETASFTLGYILSASFSNFASTASYVLNGGGTSGPVAAADITDAGTAGIAVLQAETPAQGRAALGFGETIITNIDEDYETPELTQNTKLYFAPSQDRTCDITAGAVSVGIELSVYNSGNHDYKIALTYASGKTITLGKGQFAIFDMGGDGTGLKYKGADIGTIDAIISAIYPVGSIYISATLDTVAKVKAAFGGTWVAWGSGRVPVGVDTNQSEFNSAEKTGGNKTHTHGLTDGYAKLVLKGNGQVRYQERHVTTWTDNYYIPSPGAGGSGSDSQGFGTNLDGSTNAGSSLQPYITCYMYKRTA